MLIHLEEGRHGSSTEEGIRQVFKVGEQRPDGEEVCRRQLAGLMILLILVSSLILFLMDVSFFPRSRIQDLSLLIVKNVSLLLEDLLLGD